MAMLIQIFLQGAPSRKWIIYASLTEMVKKTSSDLGVAYDGDGDRSIFCDEKGIIHWGDKTGSILSYHLIRNKKMDTTIVCPVNSSLGYIKNW